MKAVKTNYPTLASETFRHGRKQYFIDVKRALNDTHFVLITSSEQFPDAPEAYRQTVQLWEEDLAIFVEALSMVLNRIAYGDLNEPEVKMEVIKEPKGIKTLAEFDRPREKLHALGSGVLSNAGLLAVLLGTGSSKLSVLDLCGRIMQSVEDDPRLLLTRTTEDFCQFPGVGVAKAATLLAALELSRRIYLSPAH